MKAKFERSVFIPDLHAPYFDKRAYSCALKFVRHYRPSIVFIIGDWVDFYQLSKFDKRPERIHTLQEDINSGINCLRRLREAAPKARIYYIRGNHEQRLTRFLWSKAAELSSLQCLTVPQLLHLPELNIEYVEKSSMLFHGFLVKHGNVVRTRSGYSATGELEKAGISGISGHTHRLSHVFKSHFGGTYTWAEIGCLCELESEYMEGQRADWQHGIAYGEFKRNGKRFTIHVLPIIDGELVYDGQEIRA